jgi:hypothetical protein
MRKHARGLDLFCRHYANTLWTKATSAHLESYLPAGVRQHGHRRPRQPRHIPLQCTSHCLTSSQPTMSHDWASEI